MVAYLMAPLVRIRCELPVVASQSCTWNTCKIQRFGPLAQDSRLLVFLSSSDFRFLD